MEGSAGRTAYFISRAGKDAAFAIWLGKLIAAQGKTYVLQDEHFGHQNFMGAMDSALKSGARVVGLLSQAYLESDYCLAEAAAALKGDPLNREQRLVLLRLEPCAPGGVLVNIAFTDLLPERRQTDASPLVLRILRALGFDTPRLGGLPPPPEGTLSKSIQVLHPEVQAVPGFTGRADELAAVEQALWAKGGRAALTDAFSAAATGPPPPCGEGLGVGVAKSGTASAIPPPGASRHPPREGEGKKAAAVKGLGGVGKSVLAKEYAWRNRIRYQGVWWVRAEQRETLLDDLIELGSRFIPGLKEVPERDKAARQTLDWLEQAGFEKPWLMVYDNIEQPGHIETLTPRTGAHVLITTRWSDWGQAAAPVKVGVFPPDVAAQFLLDATSRTDRAAAAKLAAALGHLPLALDHAAAYIRRTGIDFATYEKLAADLLKKAPKGVDYDTPVFATFSLAIDKANEACPEAEKLMAICAFLAPDRIPLDLFTEKVLSEITRNDAVAALQEVSLITLETLDDGSPVLSVHRLVQVVMRGRLKDLQESDNIAVLATELLWYSFPNGADPRHGLGRWSHYEPMFPHVAAVIRTAPDRAKAVSRLGPLLERWRDAQTARTVAFRERLAVAALKGFYISAPPATPEPGQEPAKRGFLRRLLGRA